MPSMNACGRLVPALTALLAAALISACNGDEETQELSITATGSKDDVTYEAPAEVDAGVAEISFTNEATGGDELDAQLIRAEGDRPADEVAAELQKATQGRPVADWFQAAGGPGPTAEGETSSVTQVLEPGTYYLAGDPENPNLPLTSFEVTGEGDGDLPDADGTVSAVEYSFDSDGLPAGESSILLENTGAEWHHFLAAQLKEGATIEDAKRYLQSEGEGGGPPPFVGGPEAANPIESTVLEGGDSQLVDVQLDPGRYAFFCFIADKTGGPPHVVKGMVSEVTVE